jgi:signal transduction histidine kinase
MTAVLRSLRLRARIMLVVIGGAILPLALIGAWLTASAARSGRALLQTELDTSLARVARRMGDRWQYRLGDVALLANNETARRVFADGELDQDASRYLQDLAKGLRLSVREFAYRDPQERVRWSSNRAAETVEPTSVEARRPIAGFNAYDAILIRRPVTDANGRSIGVVEARVLLSAVLPTDSLPLIVAGAALRIRDRDGGEVIGGPIRGAAAPASVVSTRVSLDDPPLDLELAASDARYVEPFARAERLGLLFVVAVSGLALVLTWFLARRLTASLEKVVDAAGAVAAGDLERSVAGEGDDEIGRLATAFNTMTESLRRTLRELAGREALAAVGHFAASLSHEVRNALTAVRLDLQRLQERSSGSADQALVRRALGNVQRLDAIVTGSLRVARTNPETMRSVLLEGVVRSALTTAESAFLESATRATLSVEEEHRDRVRGDPGALEQLFVNLLMNAAQAMPDGGTAQISIERSDGLSLVRIVDSGRGIAPEHLARLGQPFFSSKPEGTGLGFSIARQIAVAHGGDVRIVRTGADGTAVEVALPRERAESPA